MLDRAALEVASRLVLRRHPLLRARVVAGARGALSWRISGDDTPDLLWREGEAGGRLPRLPTPDLRRENGCRFVVVAGASACDVVLQWNHACFDGQSITPVVGDLLAAYDHLVSGAPGEPQLPPLDGEGLRDRGVRGLGPSRLLRLVPGQLVGLLGVRQFLARTPVPLVPHVPAPAEGPLPPEYPAVQTTALDAATTRAYRAAAGASGVTTNELLARDLFLALVGWRRGASLSDEESWLRLMVPVSLRPTGDTLPAANQVSSVFLDRRGRDTDDAGQLLAGLHREMERIRRHELRYTLLLSMALARRLPGGIERRAHTKGCRVSAVFTNVGRLFPGSPLAGPDGLLVAGGATLRGIEVVPPFEPWECATFCAYDYAGRLHLTLHRDPRPLSAERGAALLAAFRDHVEKAAAG